MTYFAAMRDASWYSNPGRAGRYHVIDPKTHASCCGTCRLDNESTRIELTAVVPVLRCRRKGCAEKWPC